MQEPVTQTSSPSRLPRVRSALRTPLRRVLALAGILAAATGVGGALAASASAHPCCFGEPMPLYVMHVHATYFDAGTGDLNGVECYAGVGSDTPNNKYGDTRYIRYGGETWCDKPMLQKGRANLWTFPNGGGPVANAPYYEGYGTNVYGPNEPPRFRNYSTSYYTRTSDEDSEQIEFDFTIELPPGVGGGWAAALVPAGCTGGGTRVLECKIWSPPFQYIPDEQGIPPSVAQVLDDFQDFDADYEDAGTVDETDDADEEPAILTDEGVGVGTDRARGSRWRIQLASFASDPNSKWVTMRRRGHSLVIGHAKHNQLFTKSLTRSPDHWGHVGGAFNGCGWLKGGTVGSGAVKPATPICTTNPTRMEVRSFADLVNCDLRRNRAGGEKDCTAGTVVSLNCGSTPRYQNVRPWLAMTQGGDRMAQNLGDQAVKWRYVTKDGQYVLIGLNSNTSTIAKGRYTFVPRNCLPFSLPGGPGGKWTPTAGV